MMAAVPITAREKADCAWREVRKRQQVYPRLVLQKRMTQIGADRQIAVMQEIARDYERLAEADAQEERLL
jgi:hypothetical protein